MKSIINMICKPEQWTAEVIKLYPKATFQKDGTRSWAVFEDEDVAMYSAIMGGGWIKTIEDEATK